MKKTGIYKIVNLITEKVYVGSAVDIDKRWYNHKSLLNRGLHSNKLQRTHDKYGLDSFTFEVIEECAKEVLIEREQYWIDHFDSYNNGYNSRPIAESVLGLKFPDRKRVKLSDEHKKNIGDGIRNSESFKLSIKSEDRNKKISEALKGKKLNDEHRKKLSESHIGLQSGENHPMWGRKHSEESKKKMSDSLKGKKQNPEVVKKRNENNRGKKRSDDFKKNLSEKMKGKPSPMKGKKFSEEHRRKLSEAAKNRKKKVD